jgi:hypothetical protein
MPGLKASTCTEAQLEGLDWGFGVSPSVRKLQHRHRPSRTADVENNLLDTKSLKTEGVPDSRLKLGSL